MVISPGLPVLDYTHKSSKLHPQCRSIIQNENEQVSVQILQKIHKI